MLIHNPAPYKHHPPAAGPIPPALNQPLLLQEPLPRQQAHGGSWGKLRYHFISSRHSLEAAGCNPEQRSQLFPIVTGWDRGDANELPAPTCRHRAARGRERHEQPWGLMPRRKHLSGWHRPSSIPPRSCRAPRPGCRGWMCGVWGCQSRRVSPFPGFIPREVSNRRWWDTKPALLPPQRSILIHGCPLVIALGRPGHGARCQE